MPLSTDALGRRPATVTELPLTPAQQRMWFIDRLHPGWPSHDEMVYRLHGPLDVAALEAALTLVTSRHEAVWTRFAERDGEPVQVVEPAGRVAVHLVRLDELAESEREARLRPLVGALRVAPFDLTRAPLLRVTLVRLAAEEHVLCLVLHHIVSDGTSWSILLAELRDRYAAVLAGDDRALPPPPLDFGDYVWWQHQQHTRQTQHDLAYWQERLAGAPVLALHTDFARPAERAGRGFTVRRLISADVAESVDRLAQSARCTPFMVLLAAYQVLLARHSGQDDICVGTPAAGRLHPRLESMVGLFINMLVLRGDLSGAPAFRELLKRTRKRALEALSRQDIPYEAIIRALDVPRDPSRTPLFQTLFAVHTQDGPGTELLAGIRAEHFDDGETYAMYDLGVDIWRGEDGLAVMVRFDTALFTPATAETLARQYETILRAVVADPDLAVPEIPLDGVDAGHRRLAASVGPAGEAGPPTVLAAFEARAASQPEAVAVSLAGAALTYRELDQQANQLAHALRSR
jgi:hypothetical protein